MKQASSLHRRLVALVLGVVTVVWLGVAATTWVDAQHELDELLDGHLAQGAAILIAIVVIAFIASGVTNIKQLGFGAAFAILIDATLVRGLLVPALMRIAGDANWWAPAWLRRIHARIGLSDG